MSDCACFWHLVDTLFTLANVCFWIESGHDSRIAKCLLMTQSGHAQQVYCCKAVPKARAYFLAEKSGVCTENLHPNVVVMKSAKDRVGTNDSGPLNRARDRRIFI